MKSRSSAERVPKPKIEKITGEEKNEGRKIANCVAGIATMVNKPSSFERGMFILLGHVKFIALQRFCGEILDSMSESISDKWLAL